MGISILKLEILPQTIMAALHRVQFIVHFEVIES